MKKCRVLFALFRANVFCALRPHRGYQVASHTDGQNEIDWVAVVECDGVLAQKGNRIVKEFYKDIPW